MVVAQMRGMGGAVGAVTRTGSLTRRFGVLTLVLCCLALIVRPAAAEIPPGLENSRITFLYVAPQSSQYQALYERLVKRQVLEELKAFLAPLRLPRKLALNLRECGEVDARYTRAEGVVVCYEYIDFVERLAPKDTTPEGFTRAEGIIGAVVEVMLHEIGHAVFDILDVPVYGREEDAADQIAGFIMLQFSRELAVFAIKGAAWSFLAQDQEWQGTRFADEHGTGRQRFYNYLCLGYGGAPDAFQSIVDKGLLPAPRAANCPREYQLVRNAFGKTILPFIDPDLMKLVQATRWLRQEEMK